METTNMFETVFGNKLNQQFTLSDAISLLDDLDLINIGELAEQAISIGSNIQRCSKNTPEIDLISGVQIKHGRTNPDTQHNGLKAWCSIKNHKSTILFVATERRTAKEYYFVFPYSSYKKQCGNTVGIPFDYNGDPIRSNHWWAYEVDSFKELCKLAK
jgi:hypothetical protein